MKRPRLFFGGLAAIALTLSFSASILLARQGVVKTREGKTLEGDIDEKPDQIVITMHGIRTTIDRANIDQVEYFDNIEARYQAKVAALPKKPTAADRLALARWLFDVKSYDLALKEIDEARKLDANSPEAQTLEQTVMSQRRIERNKPAGTDTTRPPADTTRPPAADTGTTPAGDKAKFLTAEDINVIRQVEWRKEDNTVPRVTVSPDIRKRYVNLKALNPGEFAAESMPRQAYDILTDPDAPAEMKRDIKITSDPQALVEYRRTIQPLIMNNCASIGCHGGHASGKFFLFNTNPERDEVAYTNFYILQWYMQKFGDRVYSMVDRTYPDHSILAQFALQLDAAELKHPELKGQTYKPIAASKQAAGYRTITTWMKGLQAGDPNVFSGKAADAPHYAYGIKYEPPTSSPKKPEAPADPKNEAPNTDAPKTDIKPPVTPKAGAVDANK
jgi:hypothetical protein